MMNRVFDMISSAVLTVMDYGVDIYDAIGARGLIVGLVFFALLFSVIIACLVGKQISVGSDAVRYKSIESKDVRRLEDKSR